MSRHLYSEVAIEQIEALEVGPDAGLYNDVILACELILNSPSLARSRSAAVLTDHGVIYRLAIPGRHPYKIFWSAEGPCVEAVFPYPG